MAFMLYFLQKKQLASFFAEKNKKFRIPLAFSRISGIIYRRVILHAIRAMDRSIAI